MQRLAGGKGANQAVAAARLGATVTLIASIGHDESGDWMWTLLEQNGLDLSLLQRSLRPTGTAFITVDEQGENQIVVAPGSNADLAIEGIELDSFDVVLAQMEVDHSVIEEAARRSPRLVLNVAPATAIDPGILDRCAVVIANEIEAQQFDSTSLDHFVLTLGARGAVHYRRGHEVTRAQARYVDAVDTVGAGDVFCAAYAIQVAQGASDVDALDFAVAAGSLATLAPGAQGALPTEEEVRQWLAQG